MNNESSNSQFSEPEKYWDDLHLGQVDKTTIGYDLYIEEKYKKHIVSIPMDTVVIDKLKAITKGNDLLTYVVFLTALNIELYKYTGNEEIVVGVPVYHSDNKKALTIKNKMLPFKNILNGAMNVKGFLIKTQQKLLDSYENQYFDLQTTLRNLNISKSIMELTPINATYNRLHSSEDIEYICNSHKNEITICIENAANDFRAVLVYNTSLYEKETIRLFGERLIQVLKEMLSNLDGSIKDVNLLNEAQKNCLLNDFNKTNVNYTQIKHTIYELFESQVEKTPNSTAVIFEDKQVTYKELNDKSNAFARMLREKGVKPEDIVGIMLERSIEMVAGIMGILKSGAAYLPIDPKNPKDRVEYMLKDASSQLLVTSPELLNGIEFAGTIIDANEEATFEGETRNLEAVNSPNDLAYVIYTSGTTGNPKGVMVEHHSLTKTMLFQKEDFGFNKDNVVLPIINYAFDGFVILFYTPLISGSKVILVNNDEMINPYKVSEYIKTYKVTDYLSVPSIYLTVLDYLSQDDPLNLKLVTLVGEEIPVKAIEFTNRLNMGIEIVNRYGPSENTVETTIMRHVEKSNKILIGKPIANTKVYILDKDNNIVPIGVPGEMCIGGNRLARGYLNRPDLTKEKFISNPYEPGKRMYKTGDMAKWLPDGNIQFLGREDNQVKIRGLRIELREIEDKLLRHPEIKEAVVVAEKNEDLDHFLIAYIAGSPVAISDIKNYLNESLPQYMVPSYIIWLERMPLTNNGKIDQKSLPKPDVNEHVNVYAAPRNFVEKELANLWEDVLGVKKVGIDDNFFDLGGHSLKANVLISKIHKNLNIEIPIKELFLNPTIRDISSYINNSSENKYQMINPCGEQEFYDTSSAQKRMYMIQQLESGTVYNIPMLFAVEGLINSERMGEAFQKLVKRHDSLRTSFEEIDGQIVQKILPDLSFSLEKRDGNGLTIETLTNDFVRSFELNKAPLMRAELAESDEATYLMVDMHHIISDGVSIQLLLNEFMGFYNRKELEPLRIQYKDFAAWQNKFLESGEIKKQEEYWVQQFNDDIPAINLPYDYNRPLMQSFEGNHKIISFNEEQTEALRKIARETGSTMHMVLLSAFYILLSKYSGQEDLVIGTPVAGRPHADLQNIIGMFVNTLALRNKATGEKSFTEFLKEVKNNSLLAYENQTYQFEELIDKVGVKRDTSRHPLFDVMFNMSHADEESDDGFNGFQLKQIRRESKLSKFDLTLHVTEHENIIKGNIEYSTRLFKEETIERMGEHFNEIITNIGRNKEAKLSEINIMTKAETQQILTVFNDTKTDYPRVKTIQELFEEQAEKNPEHIAVVFEHQRINYKNLNKKANQIARVLRKKGIKPDSIVGIMTESSIEAMIGVLGILKAGGAYLPIDKNYPIERIQYMLKDSSAQILLTSGDKEESIGFNGEWLHLKAENLYEEDSSNLPVINSAENLAYIMYSSGSTGAPKGILVEHRNVVRLVKNSHFIQFEENDAILQTGSLVFDASTFEMWGALLNGLSLILVRKETILSAVELEKEIETHSISIMWLTVALFNQLAQEKPDIFKPLRYLLVGGDALSANHINLVRSKCTNVQIINGYGPTENTTFSTTFLIDKEYDSGIPIGKPISNSSAYIIGKNGELQPVGIYGELYLGGDGVARGYLNQPELTHEKFIQNPYVRGEKIYKSGDIARWLSDGNIEFAGRADQQIKIRGFRIEIEEIERKLLSHSSIREAVVLVKENDQQGKYLCAYVTVNGVLDKPKLKDYLKVSLPDYMVPSYIKEVETIPFTTNGKVDRKALPEATSHDLIHGDYEAPSNETEENLVKIWIDVVGVSEIGMNDNFFELGGNSLKASIMVNRIHKDLNKVMPLRLFFENSTIRNISKHISKLDHKTYMKVEAAEHKNYYKTSSAQKRMYTLQQFEKASTAYNIPAVFELQGIIDKDRIENTFKRLIARHESLRTSFKTIEGEIVQSIDPDVTFTLNKRKETSKHIAEVINDFIRVFNLEEAPLCRAELVEHVEKKYLVIDMHHIVSDGMSMTVLMRDFVHLYNGDELEPLKIQYKDFSEWHNKLLLSEEMKNQEYFWLNQFSDELPVLNLPYDYKRPAIKSFEGRNTRFSLDEKTTKYLKELSKQTGSTMFMTLLSAFYILLSKYSEQEDIIIGTPIAGRPHADLESIMGMFVNTLALRNKPSGSKPFITFLKEVRANSLEAFENQSYQFEDLLVKANIEKDLSRNPLFDVMFSLTNKEKNPQLNLQTNNLIMNSMSVDSDISKFDLSLNVVEKDTVLECNFEYCTKLFKEQTIERMISHFKEVLNSICRNSEMKLSDIVMISEDEKNTMLYQFNETEAFYPKDKTIIQLFEEQVLRTPNHIAAVFGEEEITYKELNERSNRLAWGLKEKGVKPDTTVGIMVERSLEMIIGIFAIMKAGGAYLPIDPAHPNERINYILEHSGTTLLLSNHFKSKDVLFSGELIHFENTMLCDSNSLNLPGISTPKDLAYVIYTSGTTGKPKGVMIEHGSLVNRLNWMQKNYPLGEGDVILQKTPYTFDVSVWELLWWSIAGSKVVFLGPKEEREPEKILEAINRYDVTTIHFVPSMLHVFLEHLKVTGNVSKTDSLKQVFTSGEALKTTHANTFCEVVENVNLINLYGPTEATIDVTYFNCPKEKCSTIPIGKPIDNTKMHIVDKNLNLVPIGSVGELCISGDGLARGYLNNEQLTSEKFVDNPYEPGKKLYKTGDLAKWLLDGNIEYLGRTDNQIKIRGFRIELGEVEKSLLTINGILDAAVVVKEKDDDKHLAAYYLGQHLYSAEDLRKKLKAILPEYMIPTYFTKLDTMPTSSNGKVDRKVLPEPDINSLILKRYEGPQNELQEMLIQIWSDVLKREIIGIYDNFFEIGGHSLKATVATNKMHQELQVKVSLKEFFENPTIKELSDYLEDKTVYQYEMIPTCAEQDYYKTSSAQKRMYMIQQLENGTVYNMPMLFTVEGVINPERLEEAFQKLVTRHESLRTSFEEIDGQIVQKIHPDLSFSLEKSNGDEWNLEELTKGFVRSFELNKVPLLRAKLAECEERTYLMVDMHHIISDGVSIELLLTEFMEFYNRKELEPLRIQYKDFAAQQNMFLKSDEINKQEEYWTQQFKDDIPVLNLPYDYKRPLMQNFEGDQKSFILNEEQTEALRKIAREAGTTMHMVLLSAYYILLSKYSGQEDLVIGTPVAGRPHAELQNIIGMFVNTLALRNKATGEKSYMEFLQEVKVNSLLAYEHQTYQFEELIDKIGVIRNTSRHPLFDVMFNMNHAESEIERVDFDCKLKPVPMHRESKVSKFDLTLHVTEQESTIKVSFEYCTRLFKEATIDRMGEHFNEIITSIGRNTKTKLSEINMMTEAETKQILIDFNNTKTDYPREKTIQELFEEQAVKTPHHVAVVFENQQVTYGELNDKANAFAWMLRKKGVKPEAIVGIMLERSIEMIAGILGVLKSGAAYLPIDPKNPKDRVEYMLLDAKAELLVTSPELISGMKFEGTIINASEKGNFEGNTNNLGVVNKPDDLAYIIYTSGTTGNPKGVMVEHHSLTQTMLWEKEEYSYNEYNVVLPLVNYAFDGFNVLFYTPLISGSKVILVNNEDLINPYKVSEYIKTYGVTDYFSVPSIYLTVLDYLTQEEPMNLKLVTLVGEEMPVKAIEYTNRLNAEIEIVNGYGPSEGTVWTTIMRHVERNDKILIGKPISNTKILILDKDHSVVPIGVSGELCIGGSRLARGYLYRPDLTNEKFIDNPFEPGERLYKTGDTARWLADGSIEFLGRTDNQVKIRGLRIELKEIEAGLLRYPSIKETVVLANEREHYGKYLCAYVTLNGTIDKAELREFLKESLPEYMIPSYIKVVERIPLTRNGKVDQKSLPEVSSHDLVYGHYEAPRNKTEEKIVMNWKKVLGISKVGIDDNFFDLGGDSLTLIKLISELRNDFEINMDMITLYKNPTIKYISKYILNEKYRETYGEDNVHLLNEKQERNIFAFPAVGGFGIVYSDLAKVINSHSFYAFDFIEADDRIGKYADILLCLQQKGPYQLLGYSAGGNLAFEVAAELKRRGREVTDLILLDSYKIDNTQTRINSTYTANLYQNIVEEAKNDPLYREYLEIDHFREKIINRVKTYINYLNSLTNESLIDAEIHLIEADEEKEEKGTNHFLLLEWEEFTTKKVKRYKGFGEHGDMLLKDNLAKNKGIITNILNETKKQLTV
ncbi:amino acid adenylation domain-containing protein [Peribacillus simplex]|uniref:non-ribosomal peptide synthetase n=1 Tax=Peribacillus simplex TaxID=1478 RepID=UPI00298E20A1|nr:non-ribosomal peptide synthetase [Peribacillus simplex]MDW7614145.1 amino acid adenylation domain-containing protein [Peribacillus simplex]